MEEMMYKNRLQEYTQKSSIPIPVYKTINEGSSHLPKFRSTVFVDGENYTSPTTFSKIKEAEKNVAKIAFESISRKPKEEAFPFIFQDTSLCKSIINEYAVKMKLGKPTFVTKASHGLVSVFVSDLVLNDVTYTGQRGKNKKEAEQLAARAAILSIMDSESKMTMSEIIKSKEKLYTVLHGSVVDQKSVGDNVTDDGGNQCVLEMSLDKRKEPAAPEDITTVSSFNAGSCALAQPFHEFKKPKVETSSSEVIPYPITFVPPVHIPKIEFVPCASSGKKKNLKKKQSERTVGGDTQIPDSVMPLAQVPPCSVSQ